MRKDPLVEGEVYHIFNKSIAKFVIFHNKFDYLRMLNAFRYYQSDKVDISFSRYASNKEIREQIKYNNGYVPLNPLSANEKLVEIIAYCLMPTHIHFMLQQCKMNGISAFMNNIQNSYTRYFNLKYERKGPLWVGRFKSVLVESDMQLLHLSRYIHLNPVTSRDVDNPEKWLASSYKEYLNIDKINQIACFKNFLAIKPKEYKYFIEDRIDYQRELAAMKHLIIE